MAVPPRNDVLYYFGVFWHDFPIFGAYNLTLGRKHETPRASVQTDHTRTVLVKLRLKMHRIKYHQGVPESRPIIQ